MRSLDKIANRLKNRALQLWKKVVKKRAGYKCEICGGTKMVQAHHIESYRVCPALRYDVHNGAALCVRHHKFGIDAAHNSFFTMWSLLFPKRVSDVMWIGKHRYDKVEYTEETLGPIIKNLEEMLNVEDSKKD